METANRELALCRNGWLWVRLLCACCFVPLLIGCSSTPGDPFEKFNRAMYKFNEDLDRAIVKPAADGYVKVIPRPVRTGIGNGFSNLLYGNVILNDLLQAKWGQGLSDAGRMAVNTTVGIAGIFDVATKWGLPAHKNDLGITLGKWGLPPGPYLVIPLLGPSIVRDVPDYVSVTLTNPVYWIRPEWYVTVPLAVLGTVDARARLDFLVRFRSETALDPYVFTRDAYLQYRKSEIRGEKTTQPPGDDFYDQDMSPTTRPTHAAATTTTTSPGD